MEQELGQQSLGVYNICAGYHFHPTELELIVNYLQMKVLQSSYPQGVINEHVDLYLNFTPDQLQGAAIIHRDKYMYFFSRVTKKHENGKRYSRLVLGDNGRYLGYWKASQKGKEIKGANEVTLGIETRLVFYDNKNCKTSWLMVEYKLPDNPNNQVNTEWTVCKVYEGGRTKGEENADN